MKTKTFFSILLITASIATQAQVTDTVPVKDGFYMSLKETKSTPFKINNPSDLNIRFYKRIWRDIDLKDIENEIFRTPGATLIEAIMDGIKTGLLTAYNPTDESFKKRYTAKQALSGLTDSVLVAKYDQNGNQTSSSMTLNDFNPESITKYRIKEDIFYNKQSARIETRIIGIAPLKKIAISGDVDASIGSQPAFWLYYPQARYVLVNMDVTDPDKNVYDLSMDDVFIQRRFKSQIIRESKPNGEKIADYAKTEGEMQQESERIEQKIKEYKEKTWAYPVNPNPDKTKNTKSIKK
jgi:gliding motility associated protien GldN